MQRDTEATTLACRHGHLSDASRRLLNGAILPCREVSQQRTRQGKCDPTDPSMLQCLAVESVLQVIEMPATKETTREQQDNESVCEAFGSAEESELAVNIEPPPPHIDGHQAELKTTPALVGDEDTLEGDHGECQTPQASEVLVRSFYGTDPPQEDEEAAVGNEEDDAISSCSERAATPGPSKQSVTGSGSAVRTFDCDRAPSRGY